jgi:hypothetical protein
MMFRFLFILLFFTGFSYAQKGFTGYMDKVYNFRLKVPKNWSVVPEYASNIPVYVISPLDGANDFFRENINVVVDRIDTMSLDTYYKLCLNGIKSGLTDVHILQELTDANFRTIQYTHKMRSLHLRVNAYIYRHGIYGFVITCSSDIDNFEKFAFFFDVTGRSMTFPKSK